MPSSRKRKRENKSSEATRRSKRLLKEPPIFMDSTKRTYKYDAKPVSGVSDSRPSKHDVKGYQPQPQPRQHYKVPDFSKLVRLESSTARAIDSRPSNLDANGYQHQSQPQPRQSQKTIYAPVYKDLDFSKLLSGFGSSSTSEEKPKGKDKTENNQQPRPPTRKVPTKAFKKAPGESETPYNSLWGNKENYRRVDIEQYLNKCAGSGPHPRSSYVGFVWSERCDRRLKLEEGDSLAYPSGTPTGRSARRTREFKANMARFGGNKGKK
ncbi:hypothetical protein N7481_003408 [Penicillium waksmanii]|uniref:uncharacterized protein n=1 Tax=Penicillium waksmanii TaxID=69791 RepID=UPI002548F399|nr:uncharacterized protein N7481_003408 [Penicillium waksmanii]KAJ5988198.1 hypothetical protein N7481_003408 [Penicillium waksmanii]